MDLIVLLSLLALGWLIAPIVLLIALVVARNEVRTLQQRLAIAENTRHHAHGTPSSTASPVDIPITTDAESRHSPGMVEQLLLLRLELQRLADTDVLPPTRHQELQAVLNQLEAAHLRRSGVTPGDKVWQIRRDLAWGLLAHASAVPLSAPPWAAEPPAPVSPLPAAPIAYPQQAAAPGLSQPQPNVTPTLAATDPVDLAAAPEPSPRLTPAPTTTAAIDWSESAAYSTRSDWRPSAPNPLERALHALSGWPRLIAPFLAQNIGWFIGGFCFITGALFLIANTRGFSNALVVFASLTGATAFLLWTGYRLRRQRPELALASNVLLILGLLLGPLDLAVATGLAHASAGHGGLLALSLALMAGALAAFAWAAALVSGLLDRSLMGRYPAILTGLAALQLAGPLAIFFPGWPLLAALHGVLLGLLGYGLRRFIDAWLQRLFTDQRFITYYAAGLLVYTAAVSFIHLSWTWPEPLPVGYAGPVLMVVCSLLFPVDAALKERLRLFPFLSRASLALYGLSVIALAVASRSAPMLTLTLALGALLYAWISWRYRTLPPLYLFLGCAVGLYGDALLRFLPPAWHGLAGLPGLLALLALSHWAAIRSRDLARHGLAIFGLLLLALTAWSLFWSAPGWIAALTAGLAAGLIHGATRLALRWPAADPRWAWADGLSLILALAATLTAPAPLDWSMRTALGGLALAALWAGLSLHPRYLSALGRRVFLHGALGQIALSLGLLVWALGLNFLQRWEALAALTLAGAVLLRLSLGWRWQALFYGALICAGGIGIWFKHRYFPSSSSGLGELLAVLALWGLLWRWAGQARLRAALLDQTIPESEPPELSSGPAGRPALMRAPLEQAMGLLWLIGLVRLGQHWLTDPSSLTGLAASGLALFSGILLTLYFRQFRWLALPLLIGLIGLLLPLAGVGWSLPWLNGLAALYALAGWRLGLLWLDQPLVQRLARMLTGPVADRARSVSDRAAAEASLRDGALWIVTAVVLTSGWWSVAGGAASAIWPGLGLCLVVLTWISLRDRSTACAQAALAVLVLGLWLLGQAPVTLLLWNQPLSNGWLSLLLAALLVGLETRPSTAALAAWRGPLAAASSLLYGLAALGAVLTFLDGASSGPGLWALLSLALFPVARPWPDAAAWRGLALPFLLSALLAGLAAGWEDPLARIALAVLWGYALWAGGNLLWPRWNARWPDWAVRPALWPGLGLIITGLASALGVWTNAWPPAVGGLAVALYLFLLLRNSAWPGLAWLAVGLLTVSGGLASGASAMLLLPLWLNGLLLLIPLWRRHGPEWAHLLGWRQADLAAPLFWLPVLALAGGLAYLLIQQMSQLWGANLALAARPTLGWALAASVTALHAFRRRPQLISAHLALVAVSVTGLALFLSLGLPHAALPLALAGWNGALLWLWRYAPAPATVWRTATDGWLHGLPALSLIILAWPLATPASGWLWSATLGLLAAATLARGWWSASATWLNAGWGLALAGVHTVWLAAHPVTLALDGVWLDLAPWWALQAGLLLLALRAARRRWPLEQALADPASDPEQSARLSALTTALKPCGSSLLALTLLWLGLHGGALLAYLVGWGAWPWGFGGMAAALAASAAWLILASLATLRAWRCPDQSGWIYLAALALGGLALYGRLAAWGLSPVTPGDTAGLLAAAYGALALYHATGRPALSRLAALLPLLALATTPWTLASLWTGGALLAATVLYLALAAISPYPWPLYLGVLALNGAVYLWAPLWAARYGLWQFYIAPAAVSVLALLYLHRRELRPGVVASARLAALSALYAGAGLDVFLRPELSVFVLALALALAGVALGIALRIRAFLYAGVTFLLLNVLGQLFRLYPEQGLSRALILLGLGAAITAGMIFFNLKRETILQRVRFLRADLAAWE